MVPGGVDRRRQALLQQAPLAPVAPAFADALLRAAGKGFQLAHEAPSENPRQPPPAAVVGDVVDDHPETHRQRTMNGR